MPAAAPPVKHQIPEADAPFEIIWDRLGIPHVYAANHADAFRGMGYAAASERLWQIHMSTAFAQGEAAALLGERFVAQDALQRAANVHGAHTGLPSSEGDWIADAYLQGMNAFVSSLDEVPVEFQHAGAQPRLFNRADIAARYRFTSWFQHKSWTEKLLLGHLMSKHGVDYFRRHVLHFSVADEAVLGQLQEALQTVDPALFKLAYPEVQLGAITSGSNNWAVTGALSASGRSMLATDPHQPHSIPNTFFYVHLHVDDWDVFGAAFPGVPYFMMGYTRELAWGLTTGFIDCYDTYIERVQDNRHQTADGWQPLHSRTETIAVKNSSARDINILRTPHGPLLEPLLEQLDNNTVPVGPWQTALHWSLTDVPTSAGALARLPLANSAEEFGHFLFEDDVCPLVNNIICVDRNDGLRRFIAATTPARREVTGSVPLPGWDARYDFPHSTEASLTVEVNPECGYTLTANNDTMGERGDFYIHNFPTHSARADRIRMLLQESLQDQRKFTAAGFEAMQLDLTDMRAAEVLPDLLEVLAESSHEPVRRAHQLLSQWDHVASPDSAAACLFYPFQDRFWQRRFMRRVLDDKTLNAIPAGAPGLNRFDIAQFTAPDSPWLAYRAEMVETITHTMAEVYADVCSQLGDDPQQWRWGELHQVQFKHSLAKHETWSHMQVGPDPIGGSPTTLGMAMHMGPGPGRGKADDIPCMVYHGPAYRLVIDLADPDHARFVIAGGNGGRPDSGYVTNHYAAWLKGAYFTVALQRHELDIDQAWQIST